MTEPTPAASPDDSARHERFLELLRRAADPNGFVPFDRFMELALYGPAVGFYTREGSPLGREGDFVTAAHASPLFGRAISERIRSVATTFPSSEPFRVVDVGPGDGTLAANLLEGIAHDPALRGRTDFRFVERSPALSRRTLDRLSAVGAETGIPVRASDGVGADGPFRGVVVANELLDAQPVRRLQWDGAGWLETGVRVGDRGFASAAVPLERAVPAPALPERPQRGTIFEVSPMAEAILREVADHLSAGLFLVLDYGMDESELLTAHPSGTLAAVRRHRYVDDPLADPGSADLSVFVNFQRVRAAARSAGFREVSFQRQAEALGAWGLPRLLEEAARSAPSAEAEVRLRLGVKNLVFGFERFRALELAPPERPSAEVARAAT